MSDNGIPELLPAESADNFVLHAAGVDEKTRAAVIAMRAESRAGLPETYYVERCRRADIEITWGAGIPVVDARAYLPGWAVILCEASRSHSVKTQDRILRVARDDSSWRDAALSVWRLGGFDALVRWLTIVIRGVKE